MKISYSWRNIIQRIKPNQYRFTGWKLNMCYQWFVIQLYIQIKINFMKSLRDLVYYYFYFWIDKSLLLFQIILLNDTTIYVYSTQWSLQYFHNYWTQEYIVFEKRKIFYILKFICSQLYSFRPNIVVQFSIMWYIRYKSIEDCSC